MTCEDLRDSYEIYALGLLEGEEKREIDEHLARNCADCQKHLKRALAVNALLLSQAPEVVPPSRLKRRVMASVGRERSGLAWIAALAAAVPRSHLDPQERLLTPSPRGSRAPCGGCSALRPQRSAPRW